LQVVLVDRYRDLGVAAMRPMIFAAAVATGG
jgi:hypothetical protein